ncbi:MAG: fasciclin domain-containing protein [Mucilaginibacter sp.]
MKKPVLLAALLLAFSIFSNSVSAQTAPAAPTGDVVTTMQGSDNGSVAAFLIKAANLTTTLQGAGPYTIFAPTNDAFNKLSTTKLDSLLSDPTKLATVLKAHVIVGKFTKSDIVKALNASKDRTTTFKTVDGGTLMLAYTAGKLVLKDEHGNTSNLLLYDLQATNGVVDGLSDVL